MGNMIVFMSVLIFCFFGARVLPGSDSLRAR